MSRTRIQFPWQRSPLGRHAMACVLVLALLWAQGLGLWHAVTHGGPTSQGRGIQTLTEDRAGTNAATGLAALIGGHQSDSDCLFFDQLCHGDAMAGLASAVVPLVLPAQALALSHGLAVARWHAQFQPRGPPLSR